MKTVITQVGTYVTGDAVADALVNYSRALMDERRADIVDIPMVHSDGRQSHVQLTLGASSPIAVVDADSVDGFDEDGAADLVLARMQSRSPRAGAAFDAGELPDVPAQYDHFLP